MDRKETVNTIHLKQGRHKLNVPPCFFCLYDETEHPYYVRNFTGGDMEININHAGNYSANVPFRYCGEVSSFTNDKEPVKLADAERFRLKPISIVVNNEMKGTPARIFTEAHPARIEVSPVFFTFPKEIRLFILLHEYGHLFYATEWKVDRFALRIFLQLGYNPSQAFYALSKVLKRSPQSMDRINRIFKTLKNYNYVNSD